MFVDGLKTPDKTKLIDLSPMYDIFNSILKFSIKYIPRMFPLFDFELFRTEFIFVFKYQNKGY